MLNTRVTVPASVKALLARTGEQLKIAREERGLSREDICQSLKMHINFVIALEEGLYEDLPGAALFFASLRSYARFLGLDANIIIEECKKNKFLFEALQGEGLIERVDRTGIVSKPQSPKNLNDTNNSSPAALAKLQAGTTSNWKAEENSTENESNSKKIKTKNANQALENSLWFVVILLATAAIAFVYRYQLGIDEYVNSTLTKISSSFGSPLSFSKQCQPFKLIAKESVEVKVKGLSIGDTVAERTLFPGEELNFSDVKGVEIEISDPASAQLIYASKPLDWDKIKTNNDTYLYKCK